MLPRLALATAFAASVLFAPDAGTAADMDGPAANDKLTAQTRKMGGVMPAEQRAVDFEHLDLSTTIYPADKRIEGDATLKFRARSTVETLIVDLYPRYDIAEVELDGRPLDSAAWSNPDGQLRITLPQPLEAGDRIKARIVYSGMPHVSSRPPWEGGMVWSETADGTPWVGSTLWGAGCDLLWPCIDHPTKKPAVADLHYTVPAPLVAPANGKFIGMTEKDGWRTWHWRARSPHTYGIILNAGPFKLLEATYESRYGNSFPMKFWYLPEDEARAVELFEEFPLILDFFESRIGPYPWADQKMGVVQTSFSGMEHQTINGYGSNYEKTPYGFDTLLQHEFAHEYFGNQLSNANYDDLWLHEGFGSYMQPLYSEYLHGEMDYFSRLQSTRAGVRNEQPVVTGRERTEEEVYVSQEGPRGDIYSKGSLVLHTLRNLIGDDAFFEAVRTLVYGRPDPEPGNFEPQFATTRDFIRIVNDVTGDDLGWFFDVYLYRAALPRLESRRAGGKLRLTWITPDDLPFPMPLEVQVDDEMRVLPMSERQGEVPLPSGAHVTLDPHSKILRQSDAIDRYQRWRKEGGDEEE
jgi:aminopeptidase N